MIHIFHPDGKWSGIVGVGAQPRSKKFNFGISAIRAIRPKQWRIKIYNNFLEIFGTLHSLPIDLVWRPLFLGRGRS
jgi:hypothetical protein